MDNNWTAHRRSITLVTFASACLTVVGLSAVSAAEQGRAFDAHAATIRETTTRVDEAVALSGRAAVDSADATFTPDATNATVSAHLTALTAARAALLQVTAQAENLLHDSVRGPHVAYWNLATTDRALHAINLDDQIRALTPADNAVRADNTARRPPHAHTPRVR